MKLAVDCRWGCLWTPQTMSKHCKNPATYTKLKSKLCGLFAICTVHTPVPKHTARILSLAVTWQLEDYTVSELRLALYGV